MLQDASIVCLSPIDWNFNRQIPQEVALSLAAGGSRVLFVENTGVRRAALRAPGVSDLLGLAWRTASSVSGFEAAPWSAANAAEQLRVRTRRLLT